MSDLKNALQIGALWARTSKAGNDYTSGLIDREKLQEALNATTEPQIKIMLSSVREKKSDKSPDWRIICPDVEYKKTNGPEGSFPQSGGGYGGPSSEEIPF